MDASESGYHILLQQNRPVGKFGKGQVVLYTFCRFNRILGKISSFSPAADSFYSYAPASAA